MALLSANVNIQAHRWPGKLESLDIWFVWQRKGQVNWTMIKLSLIVSLIQSSLASGLSPADKVEAYYTPAQIIYLCLHSTETIDSSLSVAGLLKLASSCDLSNPAEVLFSTWFPCPISCFTYHFQSPSDTAKPILFTFFPISWFPIIPLFCFQRPQGLQVPDLCLSLQRTPFISSLQLRLPLKGEQGTTQLLIRKVSLKFKQNSWINNKSRNCKMGR